LKSLGGNYSKGSDWQPYVVIDGQLITGQNPASSEPVARALMHQLNARDAAETMVVRKQK
jgi:putative intracellular protease/amidase